MWWVWFVSDNDSSMEYRLEYFLVSCYTYAYGGPSEKGLLHTKERTDWALTQIKTGFTHTFRMASSLLPRIK